MPLSESSHSAAVPAVTGKNTAGGDGLSGSGHRGVVGLSDTFQGVFGKSTSNAGVAGESHAFHAVFGLSHDPNNAGVFGGNDAGKGTGFGVAGSCDTNVGVAGDSKSGTGMRGTSQTGTGVLGTSTDVGVRGTGRIGVRGESPTYQGVSGWSHDNAGIVGESQTFHAIFGISHDPNNAGVFGTNDAGNGKGFGVAGSCPTNVGVAGDSVSGTAVRGVSQTGIGVHGQGGRLAGFFQGDVEVTGDIRLTNADCAEEFSIASDAKAGPGSVMIFDERGQLRPCSTPYDRRVAGVVSGAGNYRPAIVLDRQPSEADRLPVALLGKVNCQVDADFAPVHIGDMLTTSARLGHAMKADDPQRAFGAVIGKAMQSLASGQGLIAILVALQ
jgi:hypothetical protein